MGARGSSLRVVRSGSGFGTDSGPSILLASASPRRRAIFQALGLHFAAVPSGLDESGLASGPPAQVVARLAAAKALAVVEQCGLTGAPPWVVGADTLVALPPLGFGQPADRRDAERMIRALSGRRHLVLTGVSIQAGPERVAGFVESTGVRFREIPDDELERYLDREDWRGKAGAYAIQGDAGAFVEAVEGDAWNVVGFPVHTFLDRARAAGIPVPEARRVRGALAGLWVAPTARPGRGAGQRWGPRWTAEPPPPAAGATRRRPA